LPDLAPISKEQLYLENVALKEQITSLQFQLGQVNRLLFGQKRERFVAAEQPQQATLFSIPDAEETAVESAVKTAEPVVKKKGQIAGKPNPNHAGRNEFPAHLPRVVEILTSPIVENNRLGFKKIGQIVTETLDYTPAKLFVRQRVREKHVVKTAQESQNEPQNEPQNTNKSNEQTIDADFEGVIIAPMPDRPLPKAIADAGLLAQVLVDKFVDHLPIDRQAKRWKRESGIDIKGSTVVGWIDGTCQTK
jgi:transposase